MSTMCIWLKISTASCTRWTFTRPWFFLAEMKIPTLVLVWCGGQEHEHVFAVSSWSYAYFAWLCMTVKSHVWLTFVKIWLLADMANYFRWKNNWKTSV